MSCCWFAIHSACSASLSHSRTSSSKPALRIGSRVSCPRCSARLACSRYHCALDSMPIEHPRTKAVPGTEPDSGCVISVDPGLSPAPSTVRGQGTPPSGPPPVAGFRHVFLQMGTMRQSETFLIIIDEDRKQFAVEGPLTDVQPWNRAVAAAQEVGRTSAVSTLQRRHALLRLRSGSGTMAICTVWLNWKNCMSLGDRGSAHTHEGPRSLTNSECVPQAVE